MDRRKIIKVGTDKWAKQTNKRMDVRTYMDVDVLMMSLMLSRKEICNKHACMRVVFVWSFRESANSIYIFLVSSTFAMSLTKSVISGKEMLMHWECAENVLIYL